MKQLEYKTKLEGDKSHYVIGIDPYHNDGELSSSAICVVRRTTQGDLVKHTAVGYYRSDSEEELLQQKKDVIAILEYYKGCTILQEDDEFEAKLKKYKEKLTNKALKDYTKEELFGNIENYIKFQESMKIELQRFINREFTHEIKLIR